MIDPAELRDLENRVLRSLDGEAIDDLDVLGYGEISTVLRVEGLDGPLAAKRLPKMSRDQLSKYTATFGEYLDTLRSRGVRVVDSEVVAVGEDPVTPYCLQPLQHPLLGEELSRLGHDPAVVLLSRLVDTVVRAVDHRVGLDGQVSNWAIDGDTLVYLDVTTPLLRERGGAERLDTGLFIASLPWALRGVVDRFLLDEILSHYYESRAVLLDVAGNLHKERLTALIDPLLEVANASVSPPITRDEVDRYYRSDARTWALLQKLRKADRFWQRTVRRRRYPFLLPGRIDR